MRFLLENWFYILVLAAFVAMHLFGFGCGHAGGHGNHRRSPDSGADAAGNPDRGHGAP